MYPNYRVFPCAGTTFSFIPFAVLRCLSYAFFAYVSVGLTNAIFHGKTATRKKCNDFASGIVMLGFASPASTPRNQETHVHGGPIYP